MNKKNFYLVQVGVSYSSPCFLPYGTGCISAYLSADREITEAYNIPQIIVMRETIDKVIERIKEPYCVALSCFIWNYEYNKHLAKKLKEKYPQALVIFGGHNVAPDGELLNECDYIDFLAHGEGEESTALLLKALEKGDNLEDVPNLSFRKNGKIITTKSYTPEDISAYPSPYTTGIFDGILKEFPDVEFHGTLETNRGCPYTCAYCEWCYTHKLRTFPLEKIQAEIQWMAEHKIRYCYCADANFGILPRDIEIANIVAKFHNEFGYPQVFKPCYAKESNETVFEAGYILNKNEADKGVTLAYQSLDALTLENIGRKNFTPEQFSSLYKKYQEVDIPTYTELILGLPGETLESFCKGICTLLESGQRNSMTVYDCQVYPNSLMGDKDYRKKHGIKVSHTPLLGIHYNPNFSGEEEFLDIITETATMPKFDWVKAGMFAVVLQTFHHLGLLRYFALFLHNERNVSYYDFYTSLYDYIYNECDGYTHRLFEELSARRNDTETADWTYQKDIFGTTGYYFEEGAFLELVFHSEDFWKDIEPFLKKFNLEDELFTDLLSYQKKLVRTLNVSEVTINSKYNFYDYFEHGKEFRAVANTLHIETEKIMTNWADYAREIIWFGKRYSATLLVNPRDKIEYKEDV